MDIDLGKAAGCKTILVKRLSTTNTEGTKPYAVVSDLTEAARTIIKWGEKTYNASGKSESIRSNASDSIR